MLFTLHYAAAIMLLDDAIADDIAGLLRALRYAVSHAIADAAGADAMMPLAAAAISDFFCHAA